MKKCNYHTHTSRCMHAEGLDEEYVLSAIKGGYQVLGFSDHAPWKYDDTTYVSHMRMPLSEFEGYVNSIRSLKEKYKDQIEILVGLECEYFPKYLPWLKEFLKEYELDYIIFGCHYYRSDEIPNRYYGRKTCDDEWLENYVNDVIAGLETGIYTYLAHPDLFMRARKVFDAKAKEASICICKEAKRLGVPLEFNLEGLADNHYNQVEEYPHHLFWQIASEIGNDVIIGVDAHLPYSLERNDFYQEAYDYLTSLGMHVLEEVELKSFR